MLLGGCGRLSLFAASPPLPGASPLADAPPLLLGFAPALSDLALLPLDGFGTGAAPELRLQLDHAGADGVTFAAGLVALGPLGPLGDHAVDRWRGGRGGEDGEEGEEGEEERKRVGEEERRRVGEEKRRRVGEEERMEGRSGEDGEECRR